MSEGKLQIEGAVVHVIVSVVYNLSGFLKKLTASENENLPLLTLSRADEKTDKPYTRKKIMMKRKVFFRGQGILNK